MIHGINRLAVLILFFVLLLPIPDARSGSDPFSDTRPHKRVVLLNSYHKGYQWSDEITRGVEDTLARGGVDLYVEYMDTKRHWDGAYQNLLSLLLTVKYGKGRYDAVITSDNNAFDFFSNQGHQIFGNVPLVFCGVNFLSEQDLKGVANKTGVNEQIELAGNFDLIRRLHPACQKIIVITDNTTTGKRIQNQVRKLMAAPKPLWPRLVLVYDVSEDELVSFLEALKPGTVVFFTLFFLDNEDRFFEYDQATRLVTDHSAVPVYGAWNFSLGHGIVGGHLVGGYEHGAAAARKALAVLSGQRAKNIPIQQETPTNLRFDNRQLQQHGIQSGLLPPGSEILFRPVSFYGEYKKLIWGTAALFGLLVLAFLGVTYGLVRSRRAEENVKESEKKYRSLFESSMDAIWLIEARQGLLDCNPAGLHMFGASSKEDMIGKSPLDFSPKYQPGRILSREKARQMSSRIMAGEVCLFEWLHNKLDGEAFYTSVLGTCVTINGKDIIQVTIRDITEYKRAQELLVQSEKMMSVGGLAAGMAHEINNPLAGMMQSADVIARRLTRAHMPANRDAAEKIGIPMDKIKAYMEERGILDLLTTVLESGQRMSHIVTNMLRFARKSEDTLSLNSIENLMDKTLDLAATDFNLKKHHDFKKVRIVKKYEPGLPLVLCEGNKIQQVFLNILSNGTQAMLASAARDPEFVLEIKSEREREMVCIRIRDNGPGMDEPTRKRIFEPFFTTKPVGEGTGLGLSVSYFIVTENHGGEMGVESAPGSGSEFFIRLPFRQNIG
ncbi:ABC transporter substrate binding protein [Desulfospira joergensenii]|uniref:ABC transporter substrate binding protein n=1 Tax=Desulfospira joergensenii TaxID=53329 RepID=UPI0003B48C71|nr:ABC transporter substrate binding protein [Desulfospira joergensenii]